MKLLLHACCGPCSLEPTRLLAHAGHDIAIAYMNSNIHPAEEYARRAETLRAWAASGGLPVVEGPYDPEAWERTVGAVAADAAKSREDRCRACYRLRLEETACYASAHGFDGISTTLTVSPYQYTDVIREELERAATAHKLAYVFEDFRPFYDEATRRSRELNMYRQNYCGCRISQAEAETERRERKAARKAAREAEQLKRSAEAAVAEEERLRKRAERKAYAEKQERKHRILKELREKNRDRSERPNA
ncbi:epoxyqueuosine reductase QueH [Raoultibacter phocaeensis]|uniref:epoxyqueuosine reductase QueH n=1 Tax=Raoultibacter phocaeensis TaxID=2479841 RepID=UPI0011199973|nr:epoxyqueuosine reductase QueH [Raoultibacter phocaeensis]